MEKPDVKALAERMIAAVKSHVADAIAPILIRLGEFDDRLRALPPPQKGDKGDRGDKGDAGTDFDPESLFVRDLVLAAATKVVLEAAPELKGAPGDKGDRGDAGTDADPEFIRAECARLVAELPRPKDGKDADPVDLEAIVARVVAQLPEPRPGKDGQSVDPAEVRAAVAEEVARAVAALPKPRDGEDGEDGEPGQDGASVHRDTVALMVAEQVAKAVAALPPAKDGKDGAPGRDAAELVPLPSIDESRSYPSGTWAIHAGGDIRAARATDPVKDGDILAAGWVVMREGVAGIAITQGEDPREITVAAMLTSGTKVSSKFVIPMVVDKGVWREGPHEKGDHVSWDGSGWIAQRATEDKPGTSDAWRLSTKRGRDGKDGGAAAAPASTVARIR